MEERELPQLRLYRAGYFVVGTPGFRVKATGKCPSPAASRLSRVRRARIWPFVRVDFVDNQFSVRRGGNQEGRRQIVERSSSPFGHAKPSRPPIHQDHQ